MSIFLTCLVSLLCCSRPSSVEAIPSYSSNPIILESNDKKSDLEDAIENALNYIKKALNSSSISDLQSYARKAKNCASEAENLADDLNLDNSEDYCHKGWKYARAAEGEDSKQDAIEYLTIARKALQSAYNCL